MASHNFHVPLSPQLYTRLRTEAAAAKRPATILAREAIESWLQQRRRLARRKAIMAYAAQYAGTRLDLDPELEKAGVEHLMNKRGRR